MNTVSVLPKQSIYSLRPEHGRNTCKFNRVQKLARQLPELWEKLDRFSAVSSNTWRKQCALALKICILTGIRVGNEDSASGKLSINQVETFGITTLQRKMVRFFSDKVVLQFVGKKGVRQFISITDREVCRELREYCDHYVSPGEPVFNVSDYHMRKFVRRYVGSKIQVKDFRTLRANIEATRVSMQFFKTKKPMTKREAKAEVKEICMQVAQVLGNTHSITKRSYIDPTLLQYHLEARLGLSN